jgi:hypothetical protein
MRKVLSTGKCIFAIRISEPLLILGRQPDEAFDIQQRRVSILGPWLGQSFPLIVSSASCAPSSQFRCFSANQSNRPMKCFLRDDEKVPFTGYSDVATTG